MSQKHTRRSELRRRRHRREKRIKARIRQAKEDAMNKRDKEAKRD